MKKVSIIFDLDGTLVDSSNGILFSLSAAFNASSCMPNAPLASSLIGPPLGETLRLLCPLAEELELDKLASSFKSHYDAVGFRRTIPFHGVDEMLRSLASPEITLHIATNKRKRPTSQIVDLMGWSSLFDLVLSPDSVSPALTSKAAILAKLLAEANLEAQDCLYIGDRLDDYNAALEIGIPFALAEWGFEGDVSDFPANTICLKAPDAAQQLTSLIDRKSR